MKIPTIPQNYHKFWRVVGVVFGTLILVAATLGTFVFTKNEVTPEQLYNRTISFLLGTFLVLPYSKISSRFKKTLGISIVVFFIYEIIVGTIPDAIRVPDTAGILGALILVCIIGSNALIAYEILVKGEKKK